MNKISISYARQNLPSLAEEVYFKDKSFILTKRGIPMVKIIRADKLNTKPKIKYQDIKKILQRVSKIEGIWNSKKWNSKSSVAIAEFLRERSQTKYVR